MPLSHRTIEEGMRIDILIDGRFDYMLAQDFRGIYEAQSEDTPVDYHIDLSATDFMDSTALGMLLLIREHAHKHGGSVCIEHPSMYADITLKTARFDDLFRINKAA